MRHINQLNTLDFSSANSFTETIERRASISPDKIAFIYIHTTGEEESITYADLYNSAKKIASYLQVHAQKGDRVLLLFPQGLNFIKSFIGCLLAGMVAVPAYPPRKNKNGLGLNRILDDAMPKVVLSNSDTGYLASIQKPGIILCEIDKIEENFSSTFKPVAISKTDLAFLQYTSGSTGTPKGVMVSHGNILANELYIQKTFKMSSDDILVGWLPFYHDMGLIGNILQPLFTGFTAYLMAPIDFLQSPVKWLEAISRYKATVSGGPNFAYDLCVKSISDESIKNIDLSTWNVAFNGAEPISAKALRKFYQKFSSCGFRFSSFYPCYGMAETTLLISGGSISPENMSVYLDAEHLQFNKNEQGHTILTKSELVNCGNVNDLDFKIITEDLQEQEEGRVGEIVVRGESVAQGYWNDPMKTSDIFGLKLNGLSYFRTGDLGIYVNNQLYIAGRLKDLIIFNGRNYYPQDIEYVVSQAHNYVVSNSVVAFTISSMKEKLVIVAEAKLDQLTDTEEIINAIISRLSTELELAIDELILVRKGTLLKTTSGKVQRSANKEIFLNGNFSEIARLSSLKESNRLANGALEYLKDEKEILDVLQEELRSNIALPRDQSFFNYGIDSIVIMRLVSFINNRFNIDIAADVLYEYDTLQKLVEYIDNEQKEVSASKKLSEILGYQQASSLQTSIWINQQKNVNSSAYNIPMFLNISGDLDINVLKLALNNLVRNHQILRSSFELNEGELYLNYNPISTVNLYQHKVNGEEGLNSKVKEICKKAFVFKNDLLFSVHVISNQSGSPKVLFLIHHIIVDATSLMFIVKELEHRYSSILTTGRDEIDVYENTSFDKYIHEEYESVKDKTNTKKEYWQKALSNYTEKINLPVENSAILGNREGGSIYFSFDHIITSCIRKFTDLNNINLFACLLAGYTVFLNKISGCKDLIVGTPLSLRNKQEYLNATGLLINTLMLRSKIERKDTFKTFSKEVYLNSRNAIKNGNYPFGEILKDLNISGNDDQLALTSVYFNFLDFTIEETSKRFFDVYQSNPGIDTNFDLNLYVLPDTETIQFRLDYRKHFFSEKSINNLVSYFSGIMQQLVSKPDEPISNIEYELKSQHNIDLVVSPIGYVPFNKIEGESIGSRFDRIADNFSDKVAIIGKKQKYTYRHLKERSNGIAVYLQNRSRSRKVGLFMGHSEDMIFGMLGSLKAGMCYIPIDSTYPEKRIAFLLEDAKIDIVLTNFSNLSFIKSIAQDLDIDILNIDELSTVRDFVHQVSPVELAYILYTSGSTGIPKGVMHNQDYMMHIAQSFTDSLKISKYDCISLIPSFSFSASMMDVFGALLNGASLKLLDIKEDGIESILSSIEHSEITIYHSVPTIYRALIDTITLKDKVNLQHVRLIYLAGEPLLARDVSSFQNLFSDTCMLVNGLGCTEFNICSQNFIGKQTSNESLIVSVGNDGMGLRTFIADEEGNETNGFADGQIALESDFLAIGYWNDDELSNSKFVYNNGKRVFFTGDMGRKLPDGKLLHLGRRDFQIKILGQRVELGEIEFALLNMKSIDNAVVTQKNIGNIHFICAYIISSSKIIEEDVLAQLKKVLPFYMLPQRIIQLEEYPLTATGKVDRKNLPLPERTTANLVENLVLNNTQLALFKIWEELLGTDQFIISDSFFMAGGNSLKAMQLVGKIHQKFDVKYTLSRFFEHSSIKLLAEDLDFIISRNTSILKPDFEEITI